MFFFNVLLYSVVNPYDCCKGIYGKEECLLQNSQFSDDETMCFWDADASAINELRNMTSFDNITIVDECFFREPSSHGSILISVAGISVILSIPVLFFFEFVILNVLRHPTRNDGKVHSDNGLDELPELPLPTKQKTLSHYLLSECTRLKRLAGFSDDIDETEEEKDQVANMFETRDQLIQFICNLHAYRSKLSPGVAAEFDSRWGFSPKDVKAFMVFMKKFYKEKDNHDISATNATLFTSTNIKLRPSSFSNMSFHSHCTFRRVFETCGMTLSVPRREFLLKLITFPIRI
jgi:hypothetical protein